MVPQAGAGFKLQGAGAPWHPGTLFRLLPYARMSSPGGFARHVAPAVALLVLAITLASAQASSVFASIPRLMPQALRFDGRTLTGWAVVGPGQWTVEDGALVGQGARGAAVLKSTRPFTNVILRAEVLAENGAETSLGVRCPQRDTAASHARSCYRVSLNDRHPLWPTGSLVDYQQASRRMTTAGEWTRVEVTAEGPRVTVRVNDVVTADIRDERLVDGAVTIETPQRGRVRVRSLEVAPVATPGGR
jgi:hypothetical protein